MQLVKTEKDDLLRPVQTVTGIVERRHTLPILANLLITKQGERLSFLSTDLELQITTSLGSDSASEQTLSTTVAARKLHDILRALPGGEVDVSLSDRKMTIRSGKSRFQLQTLPAEDFPTVATASDFGAGVQLAQRELKHLLAQVSFAMAQQDIRYYLNAMLLVIDGEKLSCVATDGHRLAFAATRIEGEHPQQSVIVPRKTILELQRLLEESDDPVTIELASTQIRFTFGPVEMISKLVEGKFPDYGRVIPKGYQKRFDIGREEMQRALQRAAILINEKFKGVHWHVNPGVLRIDSSNPEQEEAHQEIEIAYDGEATDLSFNVSYLLDAVSNSKADLLRFEFNSSDNSALFTIPGNEDFKYVVMPMRL